MTAAITVDALRRYAVSRSLFPSGDLTTAVQQLGYLQADPIRAPARAQDLILRHRVADYRVDDLERNYAELPLFEDSIYNYGFFHQDTMALLHPRNASQRLQTFMAAHAPLRREVLQYLKTHVETHPRELEVALAAGRRTNGWGGSSSATTLILEGLHREGRVSVCRRESGIRVYAPLKKTARAVSPTARADGLIRLMVNLYAPSPLNMMLRLVKVMGACRSGADYVQRFELMVKRGEFRIEKIDHVRYVWPAAEPMDVASIDTVRLLAPFDPVVWDRQRFEHLWGWAYRFEAYTPAAKRKLGYYALPMLWQDRVIGWANVLPGAGIEVGFAQKKPGGAEGKIFKRELDLEVDRLRVFLQTR